MHDIHMSLSKTEMTTGEQLLFSTDFNDKISVMPFVYWRFFMYHTLRTLSLFAVGLYTIDSVVYVEVDIYVISEVQILTDKDQSKYIWRTGHLKLEDWIILKVRHCNSYQVQIALKLFGKQLVSLSLSPKVNSFAIDLKPLSNIATTLFSPT